MPSEPGCIAPAESGGLVVALRSGIYRARAWGGALDCIVAAPYDTAKMRFNDGKADPEGRFWTGTIDETRTAANAQLWSLDGLIVPPRLQSKVGDATTGNGVAWSPDARIGRTRQATAFAPGTGTQRRTPWNDLASSPAGRANRRAGKLAGRITADMAADLMARPSMLTATTGSPCSRAGASSNYRQRVKRWPIGRCQRSAQPCLASAAKI